MISCFMLYMRLLDEGKACQNVASFPGSCAGEEKKEPGTHFAHGQFSQDFWEFGNFP